MRKSLIFFLSLLLCFALPLMAQEKEKEMAAEASEEKMASMPEDDAMMKPPAPLSDDDNWMLGEWEGWSKYGDVESKDWQKVSLALGGQFHIISYKSTSPMGEYEGKGAITRNPETGEVMGYWIDSMRTMSVGKGKQEGDKITMEWTDKNGTMTRTMEKVSDDKFTVTFTFPGPDGTTMTGTSEMTRVKKEEMDKS